MRKFTLSALCLTGAALLPFAHAHEQGDWLVRGGLTTVAPDETSSNIIAGGGDLGVALTIDNDSQFGINVAYFITDNINIELLAATPFKHQVNFSLPDALGTGNQLGEVTHLPPTLTANYYFNDSSAALQPYIGAGINYTFIYDESFTSTNSDAGLTDLSLDNSFGLSAQIGLDYKIDEVWHINGSVRYIDIDTEATFNVGEAKGSVNNIEIDPWVYTVSVGYTF
jgi:outer membrane protein